MIIIGTELLIDHHLGEGERNGDVGAGGNRDLFVDRPNYPGMFLNTVYFGHDVAPGEDYIGALVRRIMTQSITPISIPLRSMAEHGITRARLCLR